jgi:GNAT superfamily N-acetyltransferase
MTLDPTPVSESDDPIGELVEANLIDHSLALADARLGHVQRGGPVQWVHTGRNTLNRVVKARLLAGHEAFGISSVLQRFTAWNESLVWIVGPTSRPIALGVHLLEQGFREAGVWTGMSMDVMGRLPAANIPEWAAASIRVAEIIDAPDLQIWASIGTSNAPPAAITNFRQAFADGFMRHGFGRKAASGRNDTSSGVLPTWRFFLGYWQGQPVSRCMTYTGTNHKVVGLYQVYTEPQFQGRGIASTVVRKALRTAHIDGRQTAVVVATDDTEEFFRETGFEDRCTFGTYRWKPPA